MLQGVAPAGSPWGALQRGLDDRQPLDGEGRCAAHLKPPLGSPPLNISKQVSRQHILFCGAESAAPLIENPTRNRPTLVARSETRRIGSRWQVHQWLKERTLQNLSPS